MATENLLVEIGTEELPPKALRTLGEALRDGIVDGLAQRELGHGEVRWFATPRRLAVQIADVQLAAADREQEALGPPLERARDEAGNWTPAAAGFAKKQGVDPADLEHIDTPKGTRLGVRRTVPGARTGEALNAIICDSLRAQRSRVLLAGQDTKKKGGITNLFSTRATGSSIREAT